MERFRIELVEGGTFESFRLPFKLTKNKPIFITNLEQAEYCKLQSNISVVEIREEKKLEKPKEEFVEFKLEEPKIEEIILEEDLETEPEENGFGGWEPKKISDLKQMKKIELSDSAHELGCLLTGKENKKTLIKLIIDAQNEIKGE